MRFDVQAALAEIRAGRKSESEGLQAANPANPAKRSEISDSGLAGLARLAVRSDRNPDTQAPPIRPEYPDFEAFEERAAIIEFDGGLSRSHAELLAAQAQGYETAAALVAVVREKEEP
jgi:hypothetical protein